MTSPSPDTLAAAAELVAAVEQVAHDDTLSVSAKYEHARTVVRLLAEAVAEARLAALTEARAEAGREFGDRVMEVDEGRAHIMSLYPCDCGYFDCTAENPRPWHTRAASGPVSSPDLEET